MRTLRTTRSRGFQPVAMLPDALREGLARRAVELGGLTLVGLGALAAVALATWSVQDPSLSHATDAPIHNMLGPAGAVVADLLTQLFGLAAAFFVLPVAIWGWRLLTHRAVEREKLKLAAWPVSAALLAGFVGFFPASPGWPLPTGLGGVLGDLFTMAADAIGFTSGVARIGAAAMLGVAGLGAFAVAIGLIGPHDAEDDALAPAPRRDGRTEPVLTHAPRRAAPPVAAQAQDDYDEDEDDDRRLVSLGLLVHWGLSAKAALGRVVSRRGASSDDDERALSRILARAAA
ncbi:DNA translocase FtsK 4TM domain-containing protein, partial [Methylopila musalis]